MGSYKIIDIFEVWTRKESYGKLKGTGLNEEIFKINTLLKREDVAWLQYKLLDDYSISICKTKEEKV